MSVTTDDGPRNFTRNRFNEAVALMAELEGRLTERVKAAERRAARAERLVTEHVRRQTQAGIELYRDIVSDGKDL